MKTEKLSQAPTERELKIVEVTSETEIRHKLRVLGIHVGDTIIRYRSPLWGPVLIRNLTQNSTKVALGTGIARKITISHD
jgi:Fe2+ transport system protein FeoA